MWGSLALLSSSGLFASGFFVVGWGSVACSVLCVLSLSVLFRACQWVMVPVSGGAAWWRGCGWVAGWSGAFGSGVCLPVGLVGV